MLRRRGCRLPPPIECGASQIAIFRKMRGCLWTGRSRFPVLDHRRIPASRFDHLFGRFAIEARYPEKTRESWKARVARFMAFCGKEFPADIDRADAIRFKDHLIRRGLDPVATIRNGYFAANRAFMSWCIANDLGPVADPFRGIKIYGDRNKPKLRRNKGYNDEEAAVILAAALGPMQSRTSSISASARRWIPWICATTGARVTEVAQLRKQDVLFSTWSRRHRVQIPFIRFTLEAGPQKVFERDVPVHPDLLALGFMDFVRDAPGERLFVDPERARARSDVSGLTASAGQGVARWVRTLIDPDRTIQPNHAWRHRFNDLCRDARIHPEDRDFITGHVPANIGASYGDVNPAALLPCMCRMESHLSLVIELNPELAPLLPTPQSSVVCMTSDDNAERL